MWCEELTRWKRLWCWERLKAGEGDDRGWDGWMASPTEWAWIWVNFGSWWWSGRPGVLQFMESQSQTWLSDWNELNWTDGFSSSPVLMWELDYKESWAPKNWCLWTVVLEKTLESPLDCKEIQPVYPKVNQSWVFIGRTDVVAETPTLWPPDAKSWLIWKAVILRNIGGRWRRGQQRMRWLDGITSSI